MLDRRAIDKGWIRLIKKTFFLQKKHKKLILFCYLRYFHYQKAIKKYNVDKLVQIINTKKIKKKSTIKFREIISAVMFAGRMNPYSKCLDRTLVLAYYLHLYGYSCKVIIGIEKKDYRNGHAWVEAQNSKDKLVIDVYDVYTNYIEVYSLNINGYNIKDEYIKTIKDFIIKKLTLSKRRELDNLIEIGFNDDILNELAIMLEEKYDFTFEIPEISIEKFSTVEKIATLVETHNNNGYIYVKQ